MLQFLLYSYDRSFIESILTASLNKLEGTCNFLLMSRLSKIMEGWCKDKVAVWHLVLLLISALLFYWHHFIWFYNYLFVLFRAMSWQVHKIHVFHHLVDPPACSGIPNGCFPPLKVVQHLFHYSCELFNGHQECRERITTYFICVTA
jgi:hypothetical protein